MLRSTLPSRTEIEAPPELVERALELLERRRKAAPILFRRKWTCDLDKCDGQPHEGFAFKHARSDQVIPADERIYYVVGGRGSGKTWTGSRNFAQMVLDTEPDDGDDHTEWGVVAPTYRDCRDTLIEGPSGLIRAFGGYERDGGLVAKWDRSYGHLHTTTGALIYADSANDGGQRIQGKNLYGAWCDEVGLWKSWRRAWSESLLFAVRKGAARIFCTGTPKRSSLAKELLDDPSVGRRRLRTVDNMANLAKAAVDWLLKRYEGTTLGQQELEGILVDDVEGALWKRANIDADRLVSVYAEHDSDKVEVPTLIGWENANGVFVRIPRVWTRVVISLDPADGLDDGDEQGFCVVGRSADTHDLYVFESDGFRKTPWDYLSHAVDTALRYGVDGTPTTIVLEKNHGGKYLTGLLEQVLKDKGVRVPYMTVDAGEAKRTRAEKVAGLYEQHHVHHVDDHADLEDQMCTWTGVGREPSPDRMDALVWALTYFVDQHFGPPPKAVGKAVQWGENPLVPFGAVKWS